MSWLRYRAERGFLMLHDEAGEPASDHWTAVESIGAARRAAVSIHQLMEGEDLPAPESFIGLGPQLIDVDSLVNLTEVDPRAAMPETSPQERLDPNKEVALGLSEEAALAEAARCLNCGLICYQRTKYH